jgi:hypothetical protein
MGIDFSDSTDIFQKNLREWYHHIHI